MLSGGANCRRGWRRRRLLGQCHQLGDDLGRGQVLVGVPAHQLEQPVGEALLLDDVVLRDLAHLLLDEAAQRLDGQVGLRCCCIRSMNASSRCDRSGRPMPGRFVDVGDAAASIAPAVSCRRYSSTSGGTDIAACPALLGVELGHPDPDFLEERDVVSEAPQVSAGASRSRTTGRAGRPPGGTARRGSSSPSSTWLPGVCGSRR